MSEVIVDKNPFSNACPRCGAEVEHYCRTPASYRAAIHMERWRSAGIAHPSSEQVAAAYKLGFYYEQRATRLLRSSKALAAIAAPDVNP